MAKNLFQEGAAYSRKNNTTQPIDVLDFIAQTGFAIDENTGLPVTHNPDTGRPLGPKERMKARIGHAASKMQNGKRVLQTIHDIKRTGEDGTVVGNKRLSFYLFGLGLDDQGKHVYRPVPITIGEKQTVEIMDDAIKQNDGVVDANVLSLINKKFNKLNWVDEINPLQVKAADGTTYTTIIFDDFLQIKVPENEANFANYSVDTSKVVTGDDTPSGAHNVFDFATYNMTEDDFDARYDNSVQKIQDMDYDDIKAGIVDGTITLSKSGKKRFVMA